MGLAAEGACDRGWLSRPRTTTPSDRADKLDPRLLQLAAAQNVASAAKMLSEVPGALHLRTLQSINDISSDQSNTVVFTLPLEILKAREGFKSG